MPQSTVPSAVHGFAELGRILGCDPNSLRTAASIGLLPVYSVTRAGVRIFDAYDAANLASILNGVGGTIA